MVDVQQVTCRALELHSVQHSALFCASSGPMETQSLPCPLNTLHMHTRLQN